MNCPACRVRLSEWWGHLRASPECRRWLYDEDFILVSDGVEVLEGTVFHMQASRGVTALKGMGTCGTIRKIALLKSIREAKEYFSEIQDANDKRRNGKSLLARIGWDDRHKNHFNTPSHCGRNMYKYHEPARVG